MVEMKQVTIKQIGKADKTVIAPRNKNLLTIANDAGADITYDCKIGNCLVCPTRILSGEVDQSSKLDNDVSSQPFILTCVAFPRSDVTLRILDDDDRESADYDKYIQSIYSSWKKKPK